MRRLAALALVLLAVGGCNPDRDYLSVAGGGFIYNYRIAEATYGIALKPMRDLPADGVVEASFENPAGGPPIMLSRSGPFNPTRIAFSTPPLHGIEKGRPYKVVVTLRDGAGAPLQTIEKSFKSDVDQALMPERPLAIGPGYQRNLDRSKTAYPPSLGAAPAEPR